MPSLLGTTILGFAGYSMLIAIAPLWAVQGGANEAGAGLVTTVLMAATVLSQFLVHWALRRWGWTRVLTVGLVFLGLPSVAFTLGDALPWILALSALRGIGFGVITVCGSSAVAELTDESVRGRAVGLYGLAIAFPQFLLVPTSALMVDVLPPWVVFLLGAAPLLGLPFAVALGRRLDRSSPGLGDAAAGAAQVSSGAVPDIADDAAADTECYAEARGGVGAAGTETPDRSRSAGASLLFVLVPTIALLAVTAPGGAVLSFAPQFAPGATIALLALLAFTASSAISRWLVGGLADRFGPFWLLPAFLAVGVAGLLITVGAIAGGESAAPGLLLGMTLVGIAYGSVQNLTLVAAFAVAGRRRDLASTVWNIGFDAGTGAGSLLVGGIAAGSSFSGGFMATAVFAGITALGMAAAAFAFRRIS